MVRLASADRGDDLRVERRADARGIETQRLPLEAQESGDDRSRRDARDPGEPREEAQLVDPPQGPQMKQHGAIAATREAQRDAVLGALFGRIRRNERDRRACICCSLARHRS